MDYHKLLANRKKLLDRINYLLKEDNFVFDIDTLKYIHASLFKDFDYECGKYRRINVAREEDILYGDTVRYASSYAIDMSLKNCFNAELEKDYQMMDKDEQVENIAHLAREIWQIHPFIDGNTRTITVFLIKYLNSLGYSVDNDIFIEKSYYFRNALVKASYFNIEYGIEPDDSALVKFFRYIMLDRGIVLDDRDLDIPGLFIKQYVHERNKGRM